MEILIGDMRYSSWSLRPWLVLKRTGEPFTQTLIRLRRPDTRANAIAAGSPTGQVPALKDGGLVVWDSLAICEYLADRFPTANLWPADATARAEARAASAEMHAGFRSLRTECPMDLGLSTVADLGEETADDVRRLVSLWRGLRTKYAPQGPLLCGAWSIADAFFTPVATRIQSYGINLGTYGDDGTAEGYVEALLSQPEFLAWKALALAPASVSR